MSQSTELEKWAQFTRFPRIKAAKKEKDSQATWMNYSQISTKNAKKNESQVVDFKKLTLDQNEYYYF